MTYYTGATFLDSIIRDIGEALDNTAYRNVVLTWVNKGVDKILTNLQGHRLFNRRYEFDTEVDTRDYDVTDDGIYFSDVISIRAVDPERIISYVDYNDLRKSGYDLEASGQPQFYYLIGFDTDFGQTAVSFWPTPNSVETLESYVRISSIEIEDNSDVIPLPRNILSLLYDYVKAQALKNESNLQEYDKEIQSFFIDLQELKKQINTIAAINITNINDLPTRYQKGRRYGGYNQSGLLGYPYGTTIQGVTTLSITVPSFMDELGSPLTSGGTIALSFNTQSGRKFLGSPSDGSLGAVDFRALTANDIPTHTHTVDDIADLPSTHTQNTDTGTTQTTWVINSGGNRLILSSSGLSANRTYLFPDVAGSTVLTTGSSAGAFPTLNQNTTGTSSAFTGNLTGDVTSSGMTTSIGSGVVTNTMLAGSIDNAKLANSTISGISLGANLNNLTVSTGLQLNSGNTYNGGTAKTISIVDNSSIQKVEIVKNSGSVVGTRKQLNFIEGSNVTLTIADDSGNDQVDITIASSGGGGGSGTVTDFIFTDANGVDGTVTNSTSTPTLSIALGAITPTSVNGLTITTSTGTLTISNSKTLSVSNTLTFSGTDGSTVACGAGGTVVYLTTSQTLQNKLLDNTNTVSIKDTLFTIQDDGDATKLVVFQCSAISTGTTRTITVPDDSGVIVLSTTLATSPRFLGQVSNAAVNNDSNENTEFSVSVAANLLSTNRGLAFEALFYLNNATVTGRSITFKIKFGGTTLFTVSALSMAGSTANLVRISGNIWNSNATNLQYGLFELENRTPVDGSLGSVANSRIANTSSVDTTSANTFSITAQLSVADSNVSYKCIQANLELKY